MTQEAQIDTAMQKRSTQIYAGSGKPVVVIEPDGNVTYGPGYEPDKAARAFWGHENVPRWRRCVKHFNERAGTDAVIERDVAILWVEDDEDSLLFAVHPDGTATFSPNAPAALREFVGEMVKRFPHGVRCIDCIVIEDEAKRQERALRREERIRKAEDAHLRESVKTAGVEIGGKPVEEG
jgi:hypothetical protein